MSLNESIALGAALEQFGKLGDEIEYRPHRAFWGCRNYPRCRRTFKLRDSSSS